MASAASDSSTGLSGHLRFGHRDPVFFFPGKGFDLLNQTSSPKLDSRLPSLGSVAGCAQPIGIDAATPTGLEPATVFHMGQAPQLCIREFGGNVAMSEFRDHHGGHRLYAEIRRADSKIYLGVGFRDEPETFV